MAKAVSLDPADAERGGIFNGGVTTVKQARFGYGYAEGKNENIITIQLTHQPKGDEPRTEYLSCGAKAVTIYSISKDKTHLVPRSDQTGGLSESCNAMIFITSLTSKGFPTSKLKHGHVDCLDGLKFEARQKPMKREGLDMGADGDRPRTVLVCEKILALPGGAAVEDEEEEKDDDEDEDEKDEDEKDEDKSEDEDEDEAVDDKVVVEHLVAIVDAAGGSVKRTKLGQAAFKALKTDSNRNAIVARMVEEGLLKKAKGVTYDPKSGLVETA